VKRIHIRTDAQETFTLIADMPLVRYFFINGIIHGHNRHSSVNSNRSEGGKAK
jgi:hypothetical protein